MALISLSCFSIRDIGFAVHPGTHKSVHFAIWRDFKFVTNYREAYGIFACSGILFNHESPLRPERFVTKKIAAAAYRIATGQQKKLLLGNILIQRDWGWAPEYVEAMYSMIQADSPEDYVIA